jgi:hypothetical protein
LACDFFEYLYYGIDLMRKSLIILCVLILAACCKKEDGNGSLTNKKVEITPFKINKVILRDTQMIRSMYFDADSGRLRLWEYDEYFGKSYSYLNYTEFNALRKAVWALVRSPGAKVYVDPTTKVSSLQEVRDRVVRCAMVEETSFDTEGNEVIQSRFMCDSVSAIHNINMIRFFESWYFNPENNMIERELLGYSVHEYVADKEAFRELFDVFVSDAALEKARKYYFNKFKR